MRNLCILLFILQLFSFMGEAKMSSNSDIFEWSVTESAPKHYPMEIIVGKLYFHGEESAITLPSGGTITSGWGYAKSNGEPVKRKLPDRLSVIFFSYADRQFFRGDFDLPYDKMVALYQQALSDFNPSTDPEPYYAQIMVGVAPDGSVAVWTKGRRAREVFFGQANKIELDPSQAFDMPFSSKEQSDTYMRLGLEEEVSPEQLNKIKTTGVPVELWSRLREKYRWSVSFLHGDEALEGQFIAVNGDNNRRAEVLEQQGGISRFHAPKYMSYQIKTVRSKYIQVYEVHFDDEEVINAFELLSSFSNLSDEERVIKMEFDLKEEQSMSTVRVFNGGKSIRLRKVMFNN